MLRKAATALYPTLKADRLWPGPEDVLAEEDWEYVVRHRAYELWIAAGRPDGKHLQFWEAAERELKKASRPARDELGSTKQPKPQTGVR